MQNITLRIASLFLLGINVAANKRAHRSMRCNSCDNIICNSFMKVESYWKRHFWSWWSFLYHLHISHLLLISLFRSTFSSHYYPELFISFSSFSAEGWAYDRWNCKFSVTVIFDSADYNVIVFILLFTFLRSFFAVVSGRWYKLLEVTFKDISLPRKSIVSFENLSSIFPFFITNFDRRRDSLSYIKVLIWELRNPVKNTPDVTTSGLSIFRWVSSLWWSLRVISKIWWCFVWSYVFLLGFGTDIFFCWYVIFYFCFLHSMCQLYHLLGQLHHNYFHYHNLLHRIFFIWYIRWVCLNL